MGVQSVLILAMAVAIQGCVTNSLYTGDLTVPDREAGEDRRVVLYWTKTDPLLGSPKAGPATVLTQCGRSMTFVERPEGIVFRGDPGRDLTSDGKPVEEGKVCGRFLGHQRFVELGDGPLQVQVMCEAQFDDFSVVREGYLPAREDPYTFMISRSETSSLFGTEPDVPDPPSCERRP